jgi:hypothetical protein
MIRSSAIGGMLDLLFVEESREQVLFIGDALERVHTLVLEDQAAPGHKILHGGGDPYLAPPAIAPTRAPMCTPTPARSLPPYSMSPVCRPARTSNPSGWTAPTIASAQRTPRAGPSEVARSPSPVPRTNVPRNRAISACPILFGVVPEQAFALLGQGRCLLGLSRPNEAAPILQHARKIFERLQAAPALAETDALLAQATALSS